MSQQIIHMNVKLCFLWKINKISLFVWFGLNVAFNNLSVISRWCLNVAGSSMFTYRVLPHWNIMPQTLWHDIPPPHYTGTELTSSSSTFLICVEVLRPSQPSGVMSRAVSLPNHTFTGQAYSSKWSTSIVHILSPETDNCSSWISTFLMLSAKRKSS